MSRKFIPSSRQFKIDEVVQIISEHDNEGLTFNFGEVTEVTSDEIKVKMPGREELWIFSQETRLLISPPPPAGIKKRRIFFWEPNSSEEIKPSEEVGSNDSVEKQTLFSWIKHFFKGA
jgi:hypothetical protein